MRGHCVLGDFDKTRQFTGGHPFWLAGNQQTECLEPCRLGERCQSGRDFDLDTSPVSQIPRPRLRWKLHSTPPRGVNVPDTC